MSTAASPGVRQAAVLARLEQHPGLTAGELSRTFGLRGSVLGLLRRLEQRAQVVAVTRWQPDQGKHVCCWQVAPPGTVPPPPPPPADPVTVARIRERDRLAQRARRARIRGLPALHASAPDLSAAACHGADPDLFFGPDGERDRARRRREAQAKAICQACPVRAACYAHAVANGERWGIWGGENFETRNRTNGRKAS